MTIGLIFEGTSSPLTPLDASEVVQRALSFLPSSPDLSKSTEDILMGTYKSKKVTRPKPWRTFSAEGAPQPWNILSNNCECVARFCKVGEWSSDQATSYVHWVSTIFVNILLAFFYTGTSDCIAEKIEDQLVPAHTTLLSLGFGNLLGEFIAGLLESMILGYAGMTKKDFRLHTERLIYRRLLSFVFFTTFEVIIGPVGYKFVLRILLAHIVYQLALTKDLRLPLQVPMFIKGNLVL